MIAFPARIVLWDTEYTAWEGSQARKWAGPNEYKELVQLGAIVFNTETLQEESSLLIFIKPVRNPLLSDYFKDLTHITQQEVDEQGVSFAESAKQFHAWAKDLPCYAYGHDDKVFDLNCDLNSIANPFSKDRFFDVRDVFKRAGVDTSKFMSSTITEAFGSKSPHQGHNALNDARTISEGLQLLATRTPILKEAKRALFSRIYSALLSSFLSR